MGLQPVPILGLDGWVSTPKEKMDNLFMHFVEANHSQSTLARGYAYSFQRILFDGKDNKEYIRDELSRVLLTYYGGYYKSVNCEVVILKDPNKGDALILRIFLTAKDEYGKEYNLAKESSDIKSKTIRWANYNNFGNENIFVQ